MSESPRTQTWQLAMFFYFLGLFLLKAYLCWSQEETSNRAESRVAPLEDESAAVIQSPSSDGLMCHDGLFHVAAASVPLTDILMVTGDALINAAPNLTHAHNQINGLQQFQKHISRPLCSNWGEGCLMLLSSPSLIYSFKIYIFLFYFNLFWAE